MSERPNAETLVDTSGAFLTRSDLRALGLERRAVDAIFGELPTVNLPGYSRPMIRADDFRRLIESNTYDPARRVRPRRDEWEGTGRGG